MNRMLLVVVLPLVYLHLLSKITLPLAFLVVIGAGLIALLGISGDSVFWISLIIWGAAAGTFMVTGALLEMITKERIV